MELNVELLKWQTEVFNDLTRFKIVAAGRRCGKSRLAAWLMIIKALAISNVEIFYVAPTQGQARDIMWKVLEDLAFPVISAKHVNNMQITLVNGSRISLKGADRPDTMRGVSLEYLVMDEYADMKPTVWEEVLRPALSDREGGALFIGTPKGRNHFYDLYVYGDTSEDEHFKSWHYTSYDNETLKDSEIDMAKKSMSSYAFRQEFLASFEALGSEIFKEEWVQFSDKSPEIGDYYIAIDLAGFVDNSAGSGKKNKRLDNTAISIVKVSEHGWYIEDIVYGRWTLDETAQKIFNAVKKYQPVSVGIERGIAKQAVMSPLQDMMKRNARYFHVTELSHGNKNKVDRIVWALQGRFENNLITVGKGDWNARFLDELFQFPNHLVHDDLIDSLAYIDQLAVVAYHTDWIEEDEYEPLDIYSGY